MLLYAGDAKIWWEITGDTDTCAHQADLNIVISWFKEWLMPISAEKCIYMHFMDTKVNRYSIGKVPVHMVRSHNDLRATVSHDLKTIAHCREVPAKGLKKTQGLRTDRYPGLCHHAH